MKLWLIFAVLISIPALCVGYLDHVRAAGHTGPDPYQWATVFDIWVDYDRAGFMAFRNQYLGNTAEWDQKIKPILQLPVFPYVILPPILYFVWSFIAFLFALWPFRVRDGQTSALDYRTHPSSHRFSDVDREGLHGPRHRR